MPRFTVHAVPPDGRGIESMSCEARDETDAARQVRARGAFPVRVRPVADGWLASLGSTLRRLEGPDAVQLSHFAEQLSQLLAAGVPLEQGLALMARRSPTRPAATAARWSLPGRSGADARLDAFAGRLLTRVRQGASLSAALRAEPAVPASYSGVVQGAEAAGTLAAGLAELASAVQHRVDTRQRVVAALAYPLGLAIFCVVAVLFVLTAVIPEFAPLFEGEQHRLPPLTQAVVWLSGLVTGRIALLLAGGVLLVPAAGWAWRHWPALRRLTGRMRRSVPIVRHAMRLDLAQGLRVLASLLRGGMETSAAMQLAARSSMFGDNRRAFEACARQLREGASLSQVCAGLPDLPEAALTILLVGERAGEAAAAAQRAALWVDADSQRRIARFVALINPAAVITMGALVALIVAAVMLGVLSISQLVVR